jgi:ABC-type lipoprotein release transport system permease subunit
MIGLTAAKYASRSLLRNPRRTLLSVVGVAIGCSVGLFAKSWYAGATDWQIRAASESGVGHLQIVNEDWPQLKDNTLRVRDWREAADVARREPGVTTVSPRVRAFGLLALGNRAEAVVAIGIDPDQERMSNRIIRRATIIGRFLEEGEEDAVVIGRGLAAALGAEVDDRLVVTLSGKDEVQNAMLTVVGIIDAGVQSLDDTLCYAGLAQIERLTGREGAGEIGIMLEHPDLIGRVQASLAPKVPAGNAVVTWGDVNTALSTNIESDTRSFDMMIVIIMVVVGLFIMSAQLAAVLERSREFAVLSALGMKSGGVVGLILVEGVLTGVLGGALATLIGGGLAYWLSGGINIEVVFGDMMGSMGVMMDPIVYGAVGTWIIWYALVVCTTATVIASIIPAWKATRVDPAEALRMV